MNNDTQTKVVRHGQCLCGAVKVTSTSPNSKVGACHCGMCRQWSSGPYMEIDCGKDVSFQGAYNITVYGSSPWAERGFCSKCGSNLFYRLKGSGEYQMSAGLFEDTEGFVFDLQVFIDKKPDFYNFAEKTKTMTEAEIFAKYGSPDETK